MFMKFLLRQIFENGFFAQKKQENRRLFFLFHSFPFSASSSYPVTLSDLAGYNSKSSHNFTKIPPSLLFIVSSLTSRFQPFCLLLFPSSNPSLSPGFQSHPASRGQRARNFWLSSDLSFGRTVLHPPSFFLFSIFIHTSFRACFLSVSSFHHFFFSNIGTTIICFTTKIERHLCYSQIVSLLLFNISLFFLYLICRISFFFFHFF